MLRLVPLMLGLAFVTPSKAQAQQLLSLGVRAGVSQSTMSLSGGVAPAGRTGFLVGPTAMLRLSDAVAFQFDALVVRKGFAEDAASGVTTALKLSYLDVPLVAVWSLPKAGRGTLQARIQGGTSVGFRVQCSVEGAGDATGIADCNPDNVATFDLGLVGGIGVKIGKGHGGLMLDATYTYGLLDANLNTDLTARNRTLLLSAGFSFPII